MLGFSTEGCRSVWFQHSDVDDTRWGRQGWRRRRRSHVRLCKWLHVPVRLLIEGNRGHMGQGRYHATRDP